MMKAPDPVNPMGVSIKLRIDPFDVRPGTERQVCKRYNLEIKEPIDVVRLYAKMSGTSHHFNLYKGIGAKAKEPVTPKEAMTHDCPPAADQLNGGAAYIFGSSSPEKYFDTPKGVAFHLEPGQLLILEQHVINASPNVKKGEVDLELIGAPMGDAIAHHADVMWLANWGIYLPAQQERTVTGRCTMPYDVDTFMMWSHTHALGTHFSIDKVSMGQVSRLYDSYDWEHPVALQQNPPLSLRKGEALSWNCKYKNTTSRTVTAGKDSTDEMCIAFVAGYPRGQKSAAPISCNVFF